MRIEGRFLLQAAIVAAGLLTLFGSGGGEPFCLGCVPLPPPSGPSVTLGPGKRTVQAGLAVTLTAVVTGAAQPAFAWCRSEPGRAQCDAIPGATGATYTLANATAADDGAMYRVTVTDAAGFAAAETVLLVSPNPPVAAEDGEFAAASWTLAGVVQPATPAVSHTETTLPAGGNPAAYRQHRFELAVAPASVRVDAIWSGATFDPGSQGALRSIDVAFDCTQTTAPYVPYVAPMIEQGGRRYRAPESAWALCAPGPWNRLQPSSVEAQDFELVGGPACNTGEACPDFTAAGVPIRFGYAAGFNLAFLAQGQIALMVFGIDNIRATAWTR